MTAIGLSSAQAMSLRTMGSLPQYRESARLRSALARFRLLLRRRLEVRCRSRPSPWRAARPVSLGSRLEVDHDPFELHRPGQEHALARPKGLFAARALLPPPGPSIALPWGSACSARTPCWSNRCVTWTRRIVNWCLAASGCTNTRLCLPSSTRASTGISTTSVRRRDLHRGGDVLSRRGCACPGLSTYPLMIAVC